MWYLPNGEQMKQADAYTIRELGVSSLTLMERAAEACVDVIQKAALNTEHICIVCGSGNNGGDGFAIGRILVETGYRVTVVAVGNEAHLTDEARYQKERYEETGNVCSDRLGEEEYSIIIDALFGVGLSREVSGKYYELIEEMNERKGLRIAVDIPSGVSAETGAVLGTAFRADITVTFQAEKLGLILYPGKEYAGKVVTADIGISEQIFMRDNEVACRLSSEDYKKLLPERKPDSNKGTYGKLLLIAGSKGMAGAAYLGALGAYRAGAGLVRIFTSEENRIVLQSQLPEAVITTYEEQECVEEELKGLLAWADVVCIGSGIGTGLQARELLQTTLQYTEVPTVIDADGLNLLSENPEYESPARGKQIIVTPHIKEFSRLTGRSVAKIRQDRAGALKQYVAESGFACILKDARTLILSEGERICVNTSGCAAMAKAGSGDVLAGVVSGLLAQRANVYEASVLGAYLHGCAGELAAKRKGNYSILAREIADMLGYTMKK